MREMADRAGGRTDGRTVCAAPMTSRRPWTAGGSAASCTGVGASKPSAESARSSDACSPNRSQALTSAPAPAAAGAGPPTASPPPFSATRPSAVAAASSRRSARFRAASATARFLAFFAAAFSFCRARSSASASRFAAARDFFAGWPSAVDAPPSRPAQRPNQRFCHAGCPPPPPPGGEGSELKNGKH
jgi:hypothetical protein